MGVVEWGALGVAVTILIAIGGVVARLMDRLNKAEAKAEAAGKTAAAAAVQVDTLETQLVEHRVSVATEYVSRKTLETLEGKLVEAINRLGDRLDKLFQHVAGT